MSSSIYILPHNNNLSFNGVDLPNDNNAGDRSSGTTSSSESGCSTVIGQLEPIVHPHHVIGQGHYAISHGLIGQGGSDEFSHHNLNQNNNNHATPGSNEKSRVSPSVLSAWLYQASATANKVTDGGGQAPVRNWDETKVHESNANGPLMYEDNSVDVKLDSGLASLGDFKNLHGSRDESMGLIHSAKIESNPSSGSRGMFIGDATKMMSLSNSELRSTLCVPQSTELLPASLSSTTSNHLATRTMNRWPKHATHNELIQVNLIRTHQPDRMFVQNQHSLQTPIGSRAPHSHMQGIGAVMVDKARDFRTTRISYSRHQLIEKSSGSKRGGTRSNNLNMSRASAASLPALSRSSYMCRKCRAHGKLFPVKQHKRNCPFRDCTCPVCSLVNYGRHIVARQIALYRDQKNHPQPPPFPMAAARSANRSNRSFDNQGLVAVANAAVATATGYLKHPKPRRRAIMDVEVSDLDGGPHCRRCRNHGKSNPWKGHKKTCPYRYCGCQQCILISLRKSNEKNLREVVQEFVEDGPDKQEQNFPTVSPSQGALIKTKCPSTSISSSSSPETATNIFTSKTTNLSALSTTAAIPFPPLAVNPSTSFLPYPYLTQLTEAYNNTSSKMNGYWNSSQGMMSDSVLLKPLFGQNFSSPVQPPVSAAAAAASTSIPQTAVDNHVNFSTSGSSTDDKSSVANSTSLTEYSDLLQKQMSHNGPILDLVHHTRGMVEAVSNCASMGTAMKMIGENNHWPIIPRGRDKNDTNTNNLSELIPRSQPVNHVGNIYSDYAQRRFSTQEHSLYTNSDLSGPFSQTHGKLAQSVNVREFGKPSTTFHEWENSTYAESERLRSTDSPTVWSEHCIPPSTSQAHQSSSFPEVNHHELMFRNLVESATTHHSITSDIPQVQLFTDPYNQQQQQLCVSSKQTTDTQQYMSEIGQVSNPNAQDSESEFMSNIFIPTCGGENLEDAWASRDYQTRAAAFAAAAAVALRHGVSQQDILLQQQHQHQMCCNNSSLENNVEKSRYDLENGFRGIVGSMAFNTNCSSIRNPGTDSPITVVAGTDGASVITNLNDPSISYPLPTPSFTPSVSPFKIQTPDLNRLKPEPVTDVAEMDLVTGLHNSSTCSNHLLGLNQITDGNVSGENYDAGKYATSCVNDRGRGAGEVLTTEPPSQQLNQDWPARSLQSNGSIWTGNSRERFLTDQLPAYKNSPPTTTHHLVNGVIGAITIDSSTVGESKLGMQSIYPYRLLLATSEVDKNTIEEDLVDVIQPYSLEVQQQQQQQSASLTMVNGKMSSQSVGEAEWNDQSGTEFQHLASVETGVHYTPCSIIQHPNQWIGTPLC